MGAVRTELKQSLPNDHRRRGSHSYQLPAKHSAAVGAEPAGSWEEPAEAGRGQAGNAAAVAHWVTTADTAAVALWVLKYCWRHSCLALVGWMSRKGLR